MKKIFNNAFHFSITCLAFCIFFTIGITNNLTYFVTNKRLLNNGAIPINLGDIITIIPQFLFILSVVLLILNKQKVAFYVGLGAIIFSSLSLLIGSFQVRSITGSFAYVLITVSLGFILLGIILFKNRKLALNQNKGEMNENKL